MYEDGKPLLPTNIKQIGSISDGLKIYVEDYVYTYIQQYGIFAENSEKIGLLVGRREIIDKSEVLFLSGAIQGKFSKNENGMETLTDRSWEYINRQLEIYFDNLEILGWIYIQPGYGDYLNDNLIAFHNDNFRFHYNVLYICDPMEKINGFFARNEATGNIEPLRGYFIYYDRNDGMHEYMLQNRLVKAKEEETDENGIYIDINNPTRRADEEISEFRRKSRASRKRGRIIIEQKKMVNILGSLSAVLFVVCFIMGAGLVRNDDRLNNLESELAEINKSYTYLTSIINDGNVQNVFAAQNVQKADNEKKQNFNGELQKKAVIDVNDSKNENIVKTEPQSEKITEQNLTQEQTQTDATEKTTNIESSVVDKSEESSKSKSVDNRKTYVVQKGDSLSAISEKFYGHKNMTEEIMRENNLDNPDMIYFGKVLYLPIAQ